MKTSKNRNLGFTLVELMVVVAVIGILASVATPLFKQYQVKARSTEGKIILSTILRVEKAWYAEYSVYSDCLEIMGMTKPDSHYYSYGFGMTGLNSQNIAIANGAPAACSGADFYFQGTKAIGNPIAPQYGLFIANNGLNFTVSNDGQTFQAGALAYIGEETLSFNFENPILSTANAFGGLIPIQNGMLSPNYINLISINHNGNLNQSSEVWPDIVVGSGVPLY